MDKSAFWKCLDIIFAFVCGNCFFFFDVEYIYGFVGWGVCMQSRWRHSVTEPHTRWRICVTMATLWQQQDGYVILHLQQYSRRLNFFLYILLLLLLLLWMYIFLPCYYHLLYFQMFVLVLLEIFRRKILRLLNWTLFFWQTIDAASCNIPSTLDGGECSASHYGRFTSRERPPSAFE